MDSPMQMSPSCELPEPSQLDELSESCEVCELSLPSQLDELSVPCDLSEPNQLDELFEPTWSRITYSSCMLVTTGVSMCVFFYYYML